MSPSVPPSPSDHNRQQNRGYWLRTLHYWHWVSAAVCLLSILLFSITGITLNHAAQIEAKPSVTHLQSKLPAPLLQTLATHNDGQAPLPARLAEWLQSRHSIDVGQRDAEWSEDEVYVSMPGPGHDAWLSIQKADGTLEYERTDRGPIAFLNDLHKGRNTGTAWAWFIDLVAVACIVFTVTGLLLLQMHARQRRSTWPLVALGLLLPLVLILLFIH